MGDTDTDDGSDREKGELWCIKGPNNELKLARTLPEVELQIWVMILLRFIITSDPLHFVTMLLDCDH